MVYRSLKRVKQLFVLGGFGVSSIKIIDEFISCVNDKMCGATISSSVAPGEPIVAGCLFICHHADGRIARFVSRLTLILN